MDNQNNNNPKQPRPFKKNWKPNFNRHNNNHKFKHHDRRFDDINLSTKTDEEIVQILLDKQKKIGSNIFASDIRPLYELIIRQNKKIKSLEEKIFNK